MKAAEFRNVLIYVLFNRFKALFNWFFLNSISADRKTNRITGWKRSFIVWLNDWWLFYSRLLLLCDCVTHERPPGARYWGTNQGVYSDNFAHAHWQQYCILKTTQTSSYIGLTDFAAEVDMLRFCACAMKNSKKLLWKRDDNLGFRTMNNIQGFIQTPRGYNSLVFMQHPLTCIQQRGVIMEV